MSGCIREQAGNVSAADGEAAISRAVALLHRHLKSDSNLPGEGIGLVSALSAAGETAFVWDAATDRLQWESNALQVLGVPSLEAISTGSDYEFLIAPEDFERRQAAFAPFTAATLPQGNPYSIQYRLLPLGRASSASIRVEEHGRVWAADGKPARAAGVLRVISDRSEHDLLLHYRNGHDELTGQLNRTRLIASLASAIERSRQTGEASAFLMVAVSELSVINETFGFDVGDQVIAAVGRSLRQQLRAADIVGRYSSNKFGVVLTACGPGAMRLAAQRLLARVREAVIETTACRLSVNVSIGGLIIPDQARTAHEAISSAMDALSKSRQKLGSAFSVFEPSAPREARRTRNIAVANEVVSALEAGRMRLALQPVICARTGSTAFYECLLRLGRADGSTVPAGEFIGVAEQLGLARLVDRRALELAVDLIKQDPELRLALNVSGLTCTDHEWLIQLHRLTGGRKIAERLTIEITETAAIQDIDQSVAFVDTLRELGCRVAIDDFGAGYTSFRNLKHLAVDMVKIDGAFVKDLSRDSADQVFIKAMVELAQHFGMETVAEWVGDAAAARLLAESGIDYLQGYHFGRPILADERGAAASHAAAGANLAS